MQNLQLKNIFIKNGEETPIQDSKEVGENKNEGKQSKTKKTSIKAQ